MTSSPTLAVELQHPRDAPLAASSGKPYTAEPSDSPIDAWMDLMEVVEALCLQWPQPELSIGQDYRL